MDKDFLREYVNIILAIYGKHVKKIILYGSYARGDYNQDSDIDILILLDLPEIEVSDYQHELSNATFDFNFDNELDINPMAESEKVYNKWVKVHPFFKNVDKEGVVRYGAA